MVLQDYIESAKTFATETKDWRSLNEYAYYTAGMNPATMLLVVWTSAGHSMNPPKKSKKKLVSIS